MGRGVCDRELPGSLANPVSRGFFLQSCEVMLALTRLPEFNRAYHSSDLTWNSCDAAASLQLPQGLFVSFLLVTPFWTAVGLLLHALTK